ncbi:hypothetical protein GALMADRAFT_136314 [Galerina marginata CBS 339.88]|uniref:Uncharacterized protein n=1 Tax=Galerina marginata (strain CBS 339.88) TaxID=685588 RepID=A0A067TG11_GALM3|nr:hypothetical protein GALMADRAFT_136314 [Galerina marginata CBS 339.88]
MPHVPTAELQVPNSVQLSELKSLLISVVLSAFFMGIYTLVYFGTLSLYYRKVSQGRIVVFAITLLYILNMGSFAFAWWFSVWSFVDNGQTREAAFSSMFNLPRGAHIASGILAFSELLVSDGLLVWRCFHVWNRSLRVILLPLLLVAAEFGLFLSSVIALLAEHLRPSLKSALVVNKLDGTGYFVSAVASLTPTLLIAFRIYSFSCSSGISSGRFKHIVEILVESSVVYSMTLFIQALSAVLPFEVTDTRLSALQSFINNLSIPILGVVPTIMVARVYLSADDTQHLSTTHRLSELAFQRQTMRRTDDLGTVDESRGVKERNTIFVPGAGENGPA